jgi:DNA damage-inducible protein 1
VFLFLWSSFICLFTFIVSGFDIDFGSVPIPGTSQQVPARTQHADPEDPANIRELLLRNPHELSLLRERNPELAEALINGTFGKKSKL